MSDHEYRDIEVIAASGGEAVLIPRRRGGWKLGLLGGLAVLVLVALGLDAYYLISRKPLTEMLPPAAAVTKSVPPAYVASFYGVNGPTGVAVSPDAQRIYVAEGDGDHLLRAFDRTGKELFNFSPSDSQASQRSPEYLAVDGKGQLYVADSARRRVSIYGADGRFISDVNLPQAEPSSYPLGVAFDRKGDLLVTDISADRHSVIVMDQQGKLVRQLGKTGTGAGEFSFPNQAAADSRGRLYVTNGNDGRVDMFGSDGNYVGPLATGNNTGSVGLPRGIVVDNLDRLYVVDSVGCTVEVFDVSGDKPSFLYSFGGPGTGGGELSYPVGIAVDSTGRIYVADRGNARLEVWSY